MNLLLPSDPFNKSSPDDAYADEFATFKALGWGISLFSFEEFEEGDFKPRPALPLDALVVYRGWMLSPEDYGRLSDSIAAKGARLNTTPAQYQLCHYISGWYEICRELTIPSVFATEESNFVEILNNLKWEKYFVKDFVKSLSNARGSVAETVEEVAEVVGQLRHFRGKIDGGICIREFIEINPDTEERYFVFNGTAHGREEKIPKIVAEVAAIIKSPFFSVDVVEKKQGGHLVIELGDGQVSDKKNWSASRFAQVISA